MTTHSGCWSIPSRTSASWLVVRLRLHQCPACSKLCRRRGACCHPTSPGCPQRLPFGAWLLWGPYPLLPWGPWARCLLCGCIVTFDTAPVFISAGACLAVALSGPGDHRHTTASESFKAGEELQMSSLPVAYIHTMHILYSSIHCQYTTWPFTVKIIPTILCFASQELLIFSFILQVATTLTLV